MKTKEFINPIKTVFYVILNDIKVKHFINDFNDFFHFINKLIFNYIIVNY